MGPGCTFPSWEAVVRKQAVGGEKAVDGCSHRTWKGCLGFALGSQARALGANGPDPEREGEGPSTVIPARPLLELAAAGWGPREAGRKLMSWARGEVQLLRVLQGMLPLEWPLQGRPEGWAPFVSHCNAPEWWLLFGRG